MSECWFFVGSWCLGMLLAMSLFGEFLFRSEATVTPQTILEALNVLTAEYKVLQANQAIAAADLADYEVKVAAYQEAGARSTASATEVAHGIQTVAHLRQALKDAIDSLFGGAPVDDQVLRDAIDAPGPVALNPHVTTDAKLDQILATLNTLGESMSAISDAVDAMGVQIESNTTVVGSTLLLIQSMADQIAAISADSTDPATVTKLNELVAKLKADDDVLAAKVAANTPTGPPAPAPLPPAGASKKP